MEEVSFSHPEYSSGSKTKIILEVIAGLIVLAGILIFVFRSDFYTVLPTPTETPQAGGVFPLPIDDLNQQISDQTKNPASNLTDTNPFFSGTNPFDKTYENPFK